MEYSHKMVPMPQGVYVAMKHDGHLSHGIYKQGRKIHILQNTKLTDYIRVKLYNHEIQKVIDSKTRPEEENNRNNRRVLIQCTCVSLVS